VQNGSRHGLSRRDAETIVRLLPPSFRNAAKSLVLCATTESSVRVTYHPKEQVIGLHWPLAADSSVSKSEAIDEILVSLSIIAERGDLPERSSPSLRARHLEDVAALRKECEEALCLA
jgi:hypothetical protein